MAWEYPNSLLITVCGNCHLFIHNTTKIKSEKDLSKIKVKIKPKVKKKKVLTKKQKALNKLSAQDRKIQLMWDNYKIKNKKS